MKVLDTSSVNNVILDAYDRKILYSLAQNARQSYTQIAKQVGLSKDSIRYRIARLTENNVLKGYRTLVDVHQLGYLNVHFFVLLNQPNKETEATLIKTFQNYPFVRAIIKFSGKFDFEIAVIAKTLAEVDSISSRIASDCGEHLQDMNVHFIVKTLAGKTIPDNFYTSIPLSQKKKKIPYAPDQKDMTILRTLADHADIPVYTLASKIRIKQDTIQYRMKKLEDSGIIQAYIPVINFGAIGYHVFAILLRIVDFTAKREATLAEFLRTNKNILWAVKTIGTYNLVMYICTMNPQDIVTTTSELRSYFTGSLRDFETLLNYEEYKYTYMPEVVSADFSICVLRDSGGNLVI